jgi:hypothetical protein
MSRLGWVGHRRHQPTIMLSVRIVTLTVTALLMLPSASWAQDEFDLLRGFTAQQQAS